MDIEKRTKGRMDKGRRANSSSPSQVNEPQRYPEQHHKEEEEEVELKNVNDDDQPHEVEVEPQTMDDYPSGPHDVFMLINTIFTWSEACLI